MSQEFKNKIKLNSNLKIIDYNDNIYTCVIQNLRSNKIHNFQCRKCKF